MRLEYNQSICFPSVTSSSKNGGNAFKYSIFRIKSKFFTSSYCKIVFTLI